MEQITPESLVMTKTVAKIMILLCLKLKTGPQLHKLAYLHLLVRDVLATVYTLLGTHWTILALVH